MDADDEYLQPNFDPTTLRVADLRRILLFHEVDFPSSAKKAQLVNLFLDNISPKAKGLLQKKSRVRPSSKGIIKVETDEHGEVQPQIYLPEVCLMSRRALTVRRKVEHRHVSGNQPLAQQWLHPPKHPLELLGRAPPSH